MRQRKKSLKFLTLSILSFLALVYIIFFVPPTYHFPFLQSFGEGGSIFIVFFLLLFLFCFSLITFLFKSKTHGILLGLFFIGILAFRLNNLTHPFFFILLAALFLTLELLFTYKK